MQDAASLAFVRHGVVQGDGPSAAQGAVIPDVVLVAVSISAVQELPSSLSMVLVVVVVVLFSYL